MRTFSPHLEILPPAQQAFWPALQPLAALGFVLYGGTAIALRLSHRTSVDFDFFSAGPLDRATLFHACPLLTQGTVLQDTPDTLTITVPHAATGTFVTLSFFADIAFGRVGTPEWTADQVVIVASLLDLLATKLKVLLQRVAAKDYQDVAAMLEAGLTLAEGLAAAQLLFGGLFPVSESLRSLVYFEGGDLATLPLEVKRTLIAAVQRVHDLPPLALVAPTLQ